MPGIDRLPGCRLPRPDRDHVGRILFGEQPDVRRACELKSYGFLAVSAQAIPDAGGEPLVGDANVLADAETRKAHESACRRLEDETDGARLALRGQLVVVRVQHDRLGLSNTEAVLEERTARDVVLEKLRESALARADGLMDGLRLFLGGLADEHLAGFLGAAERFVLRFRAARERIDEVRRGRVDVPLDDGAALHMDEHRAGVTAEDVFVVAVDVVVALLAGRGATL